MSVAGVAAQPLREHAKWRARTRSAPLAAAREFLAQGRDHRSIEEISTRAGVGFGSFFNHFQEGKDEPFEEATLEVLDAYAAWLLSASADRDDPAEAFARSFRLPGRLALDQPEVMAPLLARGTEVLLIPRGLRDAALTDLTTGVETGCFVSVDPEVLFVAVGGALLGLPRLLHADPARDRGHGRCRGRLSRPPARHSCRRGRGDRRPTLARPAGLDPLRVVRRR